MAFAEKWGGTGIFFNVAPALVPSLAPFTAEFETLVVASSNSWAVIVVQGLPLGFVRHKTAVFVELTPSLPLRELPLFQWLRHDSKSC